MRKALLVAGCLLIAVALPLQAQDSSVRHDSFFGELWSTGEALGGGTGFDNGSWFAYPQPDQTVWWNQWFYDHPFAEDRYKVIWYDIFVTWEAVDPTGAVVTDQVPPPMIDVALNWSTPLWSELQEPVPPLPDLVFTDGRDDSWAIGRENIWSAPAPIDGNLFLPPDDPWILPEYNPEWVSIDIRFSEPLLPPNGNGIPGTPDVPVDVIYKVKIQGDISHACVPEPGSVSLILAGMIGLFLIRRRRS